MSANNAHSFRMKLYSCAGALALVTAGLAAPVHAAETQTIEFNMPAQSLDNALKNYGVAADRQVMVDTDLVEGKTAPAVIGEMSADEALQKILQGSGLAYRVTASNVVLVGDPNAKQFAEAEQSGGFFRVAQVVEEDPRPVESVSDRRANDDDEDAQDVVVVTGTRIKGVKDQFSPVTQVSREDMDLAGFSNVADVVESIPQNFGGGATIDTSSGGPGRGPGGTSVNLRGLGNQATLILLNGRRLAAGGGLGDFVDISAIPASAIDRVEILTDGASAIYGSDAIAGVVNIILRDDFNGAESRLNVGTITDGGGDYLKAAQTLGWSGDRAHAMVTYEFSDEEELETQQKEFAVNATQPTWLLPFSQKHSVFASTGAQLAEGVKITADGYFNDRKSKQFTSTTLTGLVQEFSTLNVQQFGGALGVDISLSRDWEANLSGSFSSSDQSNDAQRISDGTNELNTTKTEILSFDGSVGGPLFNIAADPVRVVAGVHYRTEDAKLFRDTSFSGVLQDFDKSRNVFAAFGEIYAPIVSEGDGSPGLESLAISAAIRYEDYSDIGSSLDPKVGLSWSPIDGLNIRGTYGTSFRAARLDQLIDQINSASLQLYVDPMGAEHVALVVGGNRDDLAPEVSTTWTVGFDLSPPSLDGLLIRGTYFNTEYTDQVGNPGLGVDSQLRAVDFTGIPQSITTAEALDFCARASFCFSFGDFFPQFAFLSFDDVELLLDGRRQNLASSKAAGFDFESSYALSSGIGDWRISLGGTLLTAFEKQAAPAAPLDDLLNTFNNPVDLKLRGGVQWNSGPISTAVFVNHVGNYIDDEVTGGDLPIGAFTTVDATLRFDLGELGDNQLTDGATLSFSVINMFNEDPPFITATPSRLLTSTTFDSANANPAGRKIGILLTKRW